MSEIAKELPPTAEELETLAALWDIYAPRKYKGITKAVAVENVGDTAPLWTSDKDGYARRDGLRVTYGEVRDALREFSLAYGKLQ